MESSDAIPGPPLFRAVASSTRPLYQLLKSINFTKKIHVEITEKGIRFTADHARVMQGVARWTKSMFTSYTTNFDSPGSDEDSDSGSESAPPTFQISLPALLEALQIFGAADAAARQSKADMDPYRSNLRHLRNHDPDAFSNHTLGMSGTCSLSYASEGGPFSIVIEELGVTTTCNLTTYISEAREEIPFALEEDPTFKIITQARWLLDAMAEIVPTSPERLTICASRGPPYLRLTSSGGAFGNTTVDFEKGLALLETLRVEQRWSQTFRFEVVNSVTEAMKIANMVSLRGDSQGVLSIQFMVEVEGAEPSFLDFRVVPYVTHEDDEDEEGERDADEGEMAGGVV
ncbi:Rad1/Rec1/Rad17 [Podospora appendiculata]|uniref:Rad1/Rec1/Rad17 n=1 Tax=Podospora appendiculata TaxID=314037 RepID=A0AAE1CH06_9PEZI|nr:Rad1/Rec1/Rad17 [Podospora appendiculata]